MIRFVVIAFFGCLLAACNGAGTPAESNGETEAGTPPAPDVSEGIVERADGRVAAELETEPETIEADEQVTLRVTNRGETGLSYGRPITVERWDGENWVETEESRNAMWTLELLYVEPGETGVEQTWPFRSDHRPETGWYRLSKELHADEDVDVDGEPARLMIRSRARVR